MKLKLFLTTALLVAVAAVTASADPSVTAPTTEGGYGTISAEKNDSYAMLAVNAGDKIEIIVSGATSDVTLLSSKEGETEGSETIQYVNQYDSATLETAGNKITFTVRELENMNGIFYLKVNDGVSTHTYYYKYGRPELVAGEEVTNATYYVRADFDKDGHKVDEATTDGKYALGYVATFGFNGATVDRYGFTLNVGDDEPKTSDAAISSEINGQGSFAFGVTVYDIPTDKTEGSDFTVTPFVTYKDATVSE